jgi:hypothetical protein
VSKPYDATLNALIDARPGDWAAFLAARLGLPPGPATLLDTDLSVTAQSDKAFRLAGPPPAVIHLELESSSHAGVPARLLRYNVLLGHPRPGAAEEPVHTVVVLLRREANAADLTGVYTRAGADGVPYLEFRYTVIRLWEESMAGLLAGGPALAPLALATAESAADLPGAVARFAERLRRPDVPGSVRDELTGFGLVLSGLVHEPTDVVPLMQRMSMTFEGTAGYEWIKAQGKAEEARRLLQLVGRQKFGPSPTADNTLGGIADTARLERMAARILTAASWDDLLATP